MKKRSNKQAPATPPPSVASETRPLPQLAEEGIFNLVSNLRAVILEARQQALHAVDVVQVRTCWAVGQHIVEFEQGGQSRAEYGKSVLAHVSAQLTSEFGKGFDERNLRYMRAFYSTYPNWNALRSELTWTQYRLFLREHDVIADQVLGQISADTLALKQESIALLSEITGGTAR